MKRIIFWLLIPLIAYSENTVWSSSGSTSFKTAANWSDGVPTESDTAIFNATSVINCTVDTAWKIGGILIDSAAYSGVYDDGGYACTTTTFIAQLKAGGNLTLSGKLVQQAAANVLLSSGGTVSATNFDLELKENTTLITKSGTTFDSLILTSGKTLTTTSSFIIKQLFINGATISNGGSITVNFSENQTFIQDGSLVGTSTYNFDAALGGKKIVFTKFIHAGTGLISISVKASSGGSDTMHFSDTLKSVVASTNPVRIYKANSQKSFFIFDSAVNLSGKAIIRIGSSNATDTAFYNFANVPIIFGKKFDDSTYNTGISVINIIGNPTWSIRGSFILGSNSIWNVAQMNLSIDSAAIISTLGKTLYNISINGGSGKIDTLRDSSSWHNFLLTSGKLKGISNGGTVTGNFSLGGEDTLFGRLASSKWWTFPNVSTWTQTNTNANRLLDSTKWDFVSGGTWDQDSSNKINRLRLGSGDKKLTFAKNNKLTINNGVAGDWSGTVDHPDSIIGPCTLSVAVRPVELYLYTENVVMDGDSMICTTGCIDGGGNVGIDFGGEPVGPNCDSIDIASVDQDTAYPGDQIALTGWWGCMTTADADSFTIILRTDDTCTVDSISNDSTILYVRLPISIDTGMIDTIAMELDTGDGSLYDTLFDANLYIALPQFTLTMAVTVGGTTTPAIGAHTVDSNASTAISWTSAAGRAFKQWNVTGGAVLGSAATTNSNTVRLSANGTVTAVDTTKQFNLTMAAAHGTTTPANGDTLVDSNSTIDITQTPDSVACVFTGWSSTGAITFNVDSTQITVKGTGTVTANHTGCDAVGSDNQRSRVMCRRRDASVGIPLTQ